MNTSNDSHFAHATYRARLDQKFVEVSFFSFMVKFESEIVVVPILAVNNIPSQYIFLSGPTWIAV